MPEEQGANRVGPGNPPAEFRFKPGQSGNPKGRPPGRSFTAALNRMLESHQIGDTPMPDGKTVAEMVVKVWLCKVLGGDFQFFKELLDRTEGKVADRVGVREQARTPGESDEARIRVIYGP